MIASPLLLLILELWFVDVYVMISKFDNNVQSAVADTGYLPIEL
jgi:hypothetical protein